MKKLVSYLLFYIGLVALGLVLGFLVGLSASPVVATVVPLLFALLTAGGAVYVLRGKDAESAATPAEQARRAALLGGQLLFFCAGFLVAIWIAIAVKRNGDFRWIVAANDGPAFHVMRQADFGLLRVSIDLDERMRNSGLSEKDRETVFADIDKAMTSRKTPSRINSQLATVLKENPEFDLDKLNGALKQMTDSIEQLESDGQTASPESLQGLRDGLQLLKDNLHTSFLHDLVNAVTDSGQTNSDTLSYEDNETIKLLLSSSIRGGSELQSIGRTIASVTEPPTSGFYGWNDGKNIGS